MDAHARASARFWLRWGTPTKTILTTKSVFQFRAGGTICGRCSERDPDPHTGLTKTPKSYFDLSRGIDAMAGSAITKEMVNTAKVGPAIGSLRQVVSSMGCVWRQQERGGGNATMEPCTPRRALVPATAFVRGTRVSRREIRFALLRLLCYRRRRCWIGGLK